MRRRAWVLVLATALLGAGVLWASNMGFKITYDLLGPPDSLSGTNWFALPFKPSSSLQSVSDLYEDLGGNSTVEAIMRYDTVTGNLVSYTGGPGNDFALIPGEGLIVDMKSTVSYTIRGSHDPSKIITLLGPESSFSGSNQFAFPYHGTATNVGQLRNEIGVDVVVNIQRWVSTTDTLESYDGSEASFNFPIVPGQSYRIKVNTTVSYLPKTQY